MNMTKKQAVEFTHTLSKTSKMNCHSYGTPARLCNVGSKLRKVPGSTCSTCYACKNAYAWSTTQEALEKRYKALTSNPTWIPAMITMIGKAKWFRWFDSGDIPSMADLHKIMAVIWATPETNHWIPTRELKLIRQYCKENTLPPNVTIRVSAAMIDGQAPTVPAGVQTSTVHKEKSAQGFLCRAPHQNNECRECRACWDNEIDNISYSAH